MLFCYCYELIYNFVQQATHKKFLKCPAAVTVDLLKKFLILKYSLTDQHQVEIIHTSEFLANDLSLIDIAYCFEWKQVIYLYYNNVFRRILLSSTD